MTNCPERTDPASMWGSVVRFTKMHGAGNDFVLVFDPDDELALDAATVRALCDRRRGVGADGLLRVVRSNSYESPDGLPCFFMDYRNADGSIAEMCGNGVRCVAHFLHERGIVDGPEIPVGTRAGLKLVRRVGEGRYAVDMGLPGFDLKSIGVEPTEGGVEVLQPSTQTRPAALRLDLGRDAPQGTGIHVEAFVVSMGNPHAVVVRDSPMVASLAEEVRVLGPLVERHRAFKNGVNVEFIAPKGDVFEARVWERGVGETLSCGTGACAAGVVALFLQESKSVGAVDAPGGHRGERRASLQFPGGTLTVVWGEESVTLEGPAVQVFEGELDLATLAYPNHEEV